MQTFGAFCMAKLELMKMSDPGWAVTGEEKDLQEFATERCYVFSVAYEC